MAFTDYGFNVEVGIDSEDQDFPQLLLKIGDPCDNVKVTKTNIRTPGDYEEFVKSSMVVLENEIRKILYLKDHF